MHEAFCLHSESDIFNPYEKHHSTVKDACEKAEALGIKNLLLYHTEDKNLANRKKLYMQEGQQYTPIIVRSFLRRQGDHYRQLLLSVRFQLIFRRCQFLISRQGSDLQDESFQMSARFYRWLLRRLLS